MNRETHPRRAETVEETPWWLDANGERIACGTTTPYRLEALAAGRLLAEGSITSAADIQGLTIVYDPPGCVGIRARVPADRAANVRRRRAHREQHGCGARYFIKCGRDALPDRNGPAAPPVAAFPDLFRLLFRAAEQRGRAGGIHAASLTDGVTLLEPITDVGRHNAVDKAIGWAVLEGLDRSTLGLVLTARVSAEIAVKAARAGVAWIASRSIPTDLALEIAAVARLPIVARAAGGDAHVFGAPAAGDAFPTPPHPDPLPRAGERGMFAEPAVAPDEAPGSDEEPVAPDAV